MWPITADSPLKQKQITAEIDTRTKLDAPFLIVTSWILVFVVKSPFSAILRKEGCPNIVQLNQAKKRGTKTKCSSSDSTVPVVTSVQLRSPCSFWTTLRNTALSLNYQNQSVKSSATTRKLSAALKKQTLQWQQGRGYIFMFYYFVKHKGP